MQCTFKKSIFQGNEGFSVFLYETNDPCVPIDARSDKESEYFEFTAVGRYLPSNELTVIELEGNWVESKHGLQMDVKSFLEHLPTGKEGIVAYLAMLDGIGPKTAEAIYDKFGSNTFEVIEVVPESLLEITGITEAKLEQIVSTYRENKSIQDIVSLLAPFGISTGKAAKIKEAFGSNAGKIIRENPFELTRIKGFGFIVVDQIAKKLGGNLDDPLRIESALAYILQEAAGKGHLYLPLDELCNKSYDLLNHGLPDKSIGMNLIQTAINRQIKCKNLCYEGNYRIVYLWRKYQEEALSANKLAAILFRATPDTHKIDTHIKNAMKKYNIMLSEKQIKAVEMSINSPISLITGGPGTGKTTILLFILFVFSALYPKKTVLLAAPTGRAARRMQESTGHDAGTIHSEFGLVADDEYDYMNNNQDVDADFIIIDESSMVDMFMFSEIIKKSKGGAKLLFIGDASQLPSIGAGNVFNELLNCKLIPKTVLDIIYRQSEDSLIPLNADKINKNNTNLDYGSSFEFIPCKTDEDASDIVTKLYLEQSRNKSIMDVQILSPFKKNTKAGSKALNEVLRDLANPIKPTKRELKIGKRTFRTGDKIMQTKNSPPVWNGDIGIVKGFHKDKQGNDLVILDFLDGRIVEYHKEDMKSIEHSYAVTIHKSQGSEYHTVIIVLLKKFYVMLRRNLVYTAVTRGKKRVVVVGEKDALDMAIHKNDTSKRNTFLGLRIIKKYQELEEHQDKESLKQSKQQMRLNA